MQLDDIKPIPAECPATTLGPRTTARFWMKAQPDLESGCWFWMGGRNKGYGQVNSRIFMHCGAHCVAYELAYGPIPEGKQIDHLCGCKACVNPDHLEAVTIGENLDRRWNGRRCHQGHVIAGRNRYVKPGGADECRICKRNGKRLYERTQRLPVSEDKA